MKQKNRFTRIYEITNFSFSLISPLVLCTLLSYFVSQKLQTGYWVILVGILIGLAVLVNNYFLFYKKHKQSLEKENKENQLPTSFNNHT